MEDSDVKKPQRLAASDPLAVIEQDPGRRIWLQPEELQAMGWEILIPPGNGHPDAPISDHLVPSSVTAASTLHGQLPAFTPAATAAIHLAPQQHPAASLPSGTASAPSYWLAQKPGHHGQLLLGSQGDWHYVPAAEYHPTHTEVHQPLVDHFQLIDAQQRVHTLQITQQPHNQITPYTASVLTQSQTLSTSGLATAGSSSTTPAQFAGDVVGAVTEDNPVLGGLLQAQGQLHVTDPDPQQGAVRAQVNTPLGYGVFSINQQGAWVYTADNSNPAIQQLAQGSVLLETVWVRSIDGSSQAITIKIHGTNDGAVIAGSDTGLVTEDKGLNGASQLHTSGQLTVSDPDAGQDHFIAQAN
uniref:VCBS domain-containing protein n=1 Tax=Chitinibacter tainanensis TaxID=230667 RepID=UPI00048FAAE0